MGGKDSKLSYLAYDDAVKRVTESELKRLKDAFKRYATSGGFLTKQVFDREVFGDAVPTKLTEYIYSGFGGTSKGLPFKDLLCGLVLLTKGKPEEKIKFCFGIYGNEQLTHIQKEQMDRMVAATEGQVPPAIAELFKEGDIADYEIFRSWLHGHADCMSLTSWLVHEPFTVTLSNELETPTFYQTLAGVTHLEEVEIIELEKRYWTLKAQSRSGRFDLETFKPITSPPLPENLAAGLFNAFDENKDGHIDFKEMACGISACCRGPLAERQKFCFKIFDIDRDGLLNKSDLIEMVAAMILVRNENRSLEEMASDSDRQLDPEQVAMEVLAEFDTDNTGSIVLEDYLVWAVKHPLPDHFLNLVFQLCHIILGLKPGCKEDEGNVVMYIAVLSPNVLMRLFQRMGNAGGTQRVAAAQCLLPSEIQNGGVRSESGRKQARTAQICKHLRKSSIEELSLRSFSSSSAFETASVTSLLQRTAAMSPAAEAGGAPEDVVTTSYTHIDGARYSSLPRANHVTRASPQRFAQDTVSNSPAGSRQSSLSPSPSPKAGKKSVSVAAVPVQRPGSIDNNSLISRPDNKVTVLTNEGGRLRRERPLVRHRDYELMPDAVWRALVSWYSATLALPRTVIVASHGDPFPELELYPLQVRLLRHQQPQRNQNQAQNFTGMMGGMAGMAVSMYGATGGNNSQPSTPRRYLAYTASFSRRHSLKQIYEFLSGRLRMAREDIRLWLYKDESNMSLLEEEERTLEELRVEDGQQLLIEVRSKDLTWPEEMNALQRSKAQGDKKNQVPTEPGATGLNNLGNTCFMNSAVQCVSNTRILTLYFTGGMHLYELNRDNPLGMKGHIAQQYANLVKELWAGSSKALAPLKLRWTIAKYAPRFNGFQQHDSQELLAMLLDGLHEDLNRVHKKPYVELKDSNGRPDEVVAKEAWDNHLLRNRSVVVDLFHGQLRSQVRCKECGHTSVRFDPFTYLSLPLPMDSCIHMEIIVMWLDGRTPVKYGLRLQLDAKYRELKLRLSELCGIETDRILLAELIGAVIKQLPQDHLKVRATVGSALYAYEVPTPLTVSASSDDEQPPRASASNATTTTTAASSSVDTRESVEPAPTAESDVNHNGELENNNHLVNNNNHTDSETSTPAGTPGHMRQQSQSSVTSSTRSTTVPNSLHGICVALHRKTIRMDVYFLTFQKTRPSLFGTPLILPTDDDTTQQDLYALVWTLVSRLVSPAASAEQGASSNHAQDCDDSLCNEYPFTLRVVQKDGLTCHWCPWYRFCRGCKLDCNDNKFKYGSSFIAVDWEPTALHLRYQTSQEKVFDEHESVAEAYKKQREPIDVYDCLQAFTKEEELGEDEKYYCSKCKDHQLASKKLQIWRLPPILIIHLKRFQFVGNRWIKSQKIVQFPMEGFECKNYLVPRVSFTESQTEDDAKTDNPVKDLRNGDLPGVVHSHGDHGIRIKTYQQLTVRLLAQGETTVGQRANGDIPRQRTASTSSVTSFRCPYDENYQDVVYDLYAMSCHTGILGGGHYIAYGKNPNEKWYYYNDSSCKEIPQEQIDRNSAYLLFYERKGLDVGKFMPDVDSREPVNLEGEDEIDSDLKKMCVVQ